MWQRLGLVISTKICCYSPVNSIMLSTRHPIVLHNSCEIIQFAPWSWWQTTSHIGVSLVMRQGEIKLPRLIFDWTDWSVILIHRQINNQKYWWYILTNRVNWATLLVVTSSLCGWLGKFLTVGNTFKGILIFICRYRWRLDGHFLSVHYQLFRSSSFSQCTSHKCR
jgi:hypothetical protein